MASTVRLGVTLWVVAVSAIDLCTQRVPNTLVLPVLAAAVAWRGLRGEWAAFLVCVGLYGVWKVGLRGGAGDAKLLMVLAALIPEADFVLTLAAVTLAVSLPWTLIRYRGRYRALLRNLRPSEERLEREGVPFAWVYALGTLVYLWGMQG